MSEQGIAAEVINAGVGGSHTGRLKDNEHHRSEHALDRLDKAVRARRPDIVIVQLGINDSYVDSANPKGQSRIFLEKYTANLTHIVETLESDGSRVIMMTPNGFGKEKEPWRRERLSRYAQAVREVAISQKAPLVDIWQAFKDYDATEDRAVDDLLLDGVHPNDKGHAIIADLLAKQIAAAIDSKVAAETRNAPPRGYSIPTVDLSGEKDLQVVVSRIKGQYLGQPDTLLLKDNKTMLVGYPEGHGGPNTILKRSDDGGLTWSERLAVPENFTNNHCAPTLHRLTDSSGKERLFIFVSYDRMQPGGAMIVSISEDNGRTWSPFKNLFREALRGTPGFRGHAPPKSVIPISGGRYLAMYHDHIQENPRIIECFQIISEDGGLTWSDPQEVTRHPRYPGAHPCEPCIIRSPDGKQLLCLLRENSRKYNSMMMVSNDEGATWSEARELPGSLTGDRHIGRYAPDGRLIITFRDRTHISPTQGDFVAWVGTYDDIINGREGQCRVRLLDNLVNADTGYSGLEALPDGTFVSTTYGHWIKSEQPYILSVRFKTENIDAKLREGIQNQFEDPEFRNVFVAGEEDIAGVKDARSKYPQFRAQNVVVTNSGAMVAICQARNTSSWSDRSGQDLVCKISRDSGNTWSPASRIATHGLQSIAPNATVYDRQKNRIHVLYNLIAWDYPNPPKGARDEKAETSCRQFALTSDDEGRTWSAPRDITEMIGAKGAVAVFGAGEGIQLRHGPNKRRLLIPGGDFYQGKKVLCFYSDDHGVTWRRGKPAPTPLNTAMASETKVAELPDGSLVLNSRCFVQTGGKQRLRTRAFSRDGGISWTPLENDPALKTVSCNGDLIVVEHPKGKDGAILLCSVPAGPGRTHGTVYVSFDGGQTWPHQKLVIPDAFAYSSLAQLPDSAIGLFYESEDYKSVKMAKFTLSWLLIGAE